MNINKVLDNKWFKFVVSFAGLAFTVILAYFDYIVFFYEIEYTNKKLFAIVAPIICVLVSLLNIYTRRSPVTVVLAMVNAVLFLPLLLLDWGNWPLLLPAAAVTIFGFFACHMNETVKTVFGTAFLLIYIIGGIVFYLFMNVFSNTVSQTVIDQGVSPSGAFRYYVIDAKNKSTGKKYVYIRPNTLDIDKGFIRLNTTVSKLVRQENNPVEFTCEWQGTKMFINGEEYFSEMSYITFENGYAAYDIADKGFKYTYFKLDYPMITTVRSYKQKIDNFIDGRKNGTTKEEPETVITVTEVTAQPKEEAAEDETKAE